MSTVENPVNAILESGLLQERINSNYPLSKGTERTSVEKTKERNSSPSVRDNAKNVTHSEAKHLSKKTAPEPETKVKVNKTNLGFVYDEEVKKAILQVVDEETKEVLFQVPPEEVIARMKENLKKQNEEMRTGIIVDKEV